MKELHTIKKNIYLEDYDVNVRPYLTQEELKAIVVEALKVDDLIDRDALTKITVLELCTDIPKETLNDLSYEDIESSGLLGDVLYNVYNYTDIAEYIEKYESIEINVKSFLNELMEEVKKMNKKLPKSTELNKAIDTLAKLKEEVQ